MVSRVWCDTCLYRFLILAFPGLSLRVRTKKNNFLISQTKHMLYPTHMLRIMGKKNFTILPVYAENFYLSKPLFPLYFASEKNQHSS